MYLGYTKENPGEMKVKMYTNSRVQLSLHFGLCQYLPCSQRAWLGSVSTASNKVFTLFSYTPKLDPVTGAYTPVAKYVSYKTPKDIASAMLDLEQAENITRGSFIESVVFTPTEQYYKISLTHAPDPPDYVAGDTDCLFVLGIGVLLRGKEYVNFRLANYTWKIFKKQDLNHDYEQFWWELYAPKGTLLMGASTGVINGSSVGYDTREKCLEDMKNAGYEHGFDILEG